MSYVRKTWLAREGTGLNKFLKSSETSGVVYLTNDPDSITQAGTPFTADAMNNIEDGIEQALALSPYDLIIDSDTALSAWAAASDTYERVLIRKGTWTLASGGVNLTASGTKTVHAEAGGILSFTSTNQALYYTSRPDSPEYSMTGVQVMAYRPTGASADSLSCFYQCINLINCYAYASNRTTAGISIGFSSCSKLLNCYAEGTTTVSLTCYGFYACEYLRACYGRGYSVSGETAAGFSTCIELSGCEAQANNVSGTSAIGFSNCTIISNCRAHAAHGGSGGGYGFHTCTGVVNSAGQGTGSFGYGYYACKKCIGNKPYAASTSGTYSASYADMGTAAACADTAAGGWNS